VLILIAVIVLRVKGKILSFIQPLLAYYGLVLLVHDARTYVEERIHHKGRLVGGYFHKLQSSGFTTKYRNCTENL